MTGPIKAPRRRRRLAVVVVQWTAIALGIILVAWYLVVRGHGKVESRAAIEDFRLARVAGVEVVPLSKAETNPLIAEPVDTSLWSNRRVEAYRETLFSEERAAVGVLTMPRLDLEVPIFEGTDEWVLNRGAGLIEGTASIGEGGNVGIAAHRDSFFRVLQDVAVGDALFLEAGGGTDRYEVESFQIVDPTNVGVLAVTDEPAVTLVTCYPFYFVGSAPKRFIVRATSARTERAEGSVDR